MGTSRLLMRKIIIRNPFHHRAKIREMLCVFKLRTLLFLQTITKRAKLSRMCSTWWIRLGAHSGLEMKMRVQSATTAMGHKWNHCIFHNQLLKKAAIQGNRVQWIFWAQRKKWALFRKNGHLINWFLLKFNLTANLSLKSLNPAK